jgi:hypothetical protein
MILHPSFCAATVGIGSHQQEQSGSVDSGYYEGHQFQNSFGR